MDMYCVEIRDINTDEVVEKSKEMNNRTSYKLEMAYNRRINLDSYYVERVKVKKELS